MKNIIIFLFSFLPSLLFAQIRVQVADGKNVAVAALTIAGTPSTNSVPVWNGSYYNPTNTASFQTLMNYWVKGGSDELTYTGATSPYVRFLSNNAQPDLSIRGTGAVTIGAYNTRTLGAPFSASQLVLSNGPTPFSATSRDWQITVEYDGSANSPMKFQYFNGTSYIQAAKIWGTGRTTFGPVGSVDAGEQLQVNGNSRFGGSSTAVAASIFKIQSVGGSADTYFSNLSPEGAITAVQGSKCYANIAGTGYSFTKRTGAGNTGWVIDFNVLESLSASSGNVLGWNGTTWLPTAFSGESTKIGVFRNSGNARGAVMSGDSVVITSANSTQPGAVNLISQTFQAGASGFKTFTSDHPFQVSADDSGATKAAGYQYTESSGTVVLAQTVSASPDANSGDWTLKVRESANPENQITVKTNGPFKGVYTKGRSFSDLKEVGGTSYNIGEGDNAIILGPSVTDINLQVIGSGTAEAPNGGDLYIYNPNAVSCTITPQAGQDIDGSPTLTLTQNKGVFLKAVLTASYTMWITIGN